MWQTSLCYVPYLLLLSFIDCLYVCSCCRHLHVLDAHVLSVKWYSTNFLSFFLTYVMINKKKPKAPVIFWCTVVMFYWLLTITMLYLSSEFNPSFSVLQSILKFLNSVYVVLGMSVDTFSIVDNNNHCCSNWPSKFTVHTCTYISMYVKMGDVLDLVLSAKAGRDILIRYRCKLWMEYNYIPSLIKAIIHLCSIALVM